MTTPRGPMIVVDVGNSKVRMARWDGGEQVPRARSDGRLAETPPLTELGVVPTPVADDPDAGDLVTELAGLVGPLAGLPQVLVSVSPLATALLAAAEPRLQVVDETWDLPFVLDVAAPAAVGPDRLCNVAAAAAAGWRRALVVDAGTATTFDLLLDGTFVGGLIAPGMALAAACLGRQAARLQPVPFEPCPLAPGRDTVSAMQRGAFHVGVLGVAAVIDQLVADHGDLPVVLTGGLGRYLQTADRPWDPHWTLRGAALLATARRESR